ncbi:[SSU ribosomal protein S18P]-alanine acetyltransferase [Thiogranum longum]|uniref:[Ribosomal protein bS18]-alanine N-acetyltransferase n=1 Tax=Thiogranum longum TaxID=1537524 RepID=A0A4R1HBS6_9GAMM|nr:ribosomal protein S18-alanine N-acetyltransferase [Thiogranum longum]TCK17630.1 [SSU ribosomal protein S18P]-alanine acetyltransferase [Thiogranum longum]
MSAILSDQGERLRPMTVNDLERVMAIEPLAYEFPWSEGIFRDCLRVGYCCWCYEENGELLGYGVMSVAAGESHILNLTVHPESQRKGIGRKLLMHFIQLARRHGADTLMLEVRPSNTAAIRLYDAMGFNEMGRRRNYYPSENGREDALLLALDLTT